MGTCHASIAIAVCSFLGLGASAAVCGETKIVDKTNSGLEVFAKDGRIAADGSTIVLVCDSNLAFSTDHNAVSDVYAKDLATGVFELISVTLAGIAGDAYSNAPRISADGRFVAFTSRASNLVASADANNKLDVFVRDRLLQTTERLSQSAAGVVGNGDSSCDSISADGRYVGFSSTASNLVPGDSVLTGDAFVHDRLLHTTTRVTVDANGVRPPGDGFIAVVSGNGAFVAFISTQALVPGIPGGGFVQAFRKDLATGTVAFVSANLSGNPATASIQLTDISDDGRFVSFVSNAPNMAAGDTSPFSDVLLRDVTLGATELISVTPAGTSAGNNASGGMLTPDARYVFFSASSADLATEDDNSSGDAFLRDRATNTTITISIGPDGHTPASYAPPTYSDSAAYDLASDGKKLLFSSVLPGLTDPPTTGSSFIRVYLRDVRGFQDLKGGLKGFHALIPKLAGNGSLAPLGVGTISLTAARPSSPMLWVLSTQLADQPFAGGILRAFPIVTLQPGFTDGAGNAAVPYMLGALPVFVPQACLQIAVLDTAAVEGVALSNALLLGFE